MSIGPCRQGFKGEQNIRANVACTALERPARLWSHPSVVTPVGAHTFCPPLNRKGREARASQRDSGSTALHLHTTGLKGWSTAECRIVGQV